MKSPGDLQHDGATAILRIPASDIGLAGCDIATHVDTNPSSDLPYSKQWLFLHARYQLYKI